MCRSVPYRQHRHATLSPLCFRMTITISRGDVLPFKGFFAQVRYADDPDSSPALGRFMTRQHFTVDCEPGQAVSIH